MRNFLIALDDFFGSNAYYNDNTGETEIDYTQEEIYNHIMQNDEYHLLGSRTVRYMIGLWFSDYEQYTEILDKFDAHAG